MVALKKIHKIVIGNTLKSNNNNNNNNLLKSTPNFIKPKMEILFAQLIVSPAATEQRQIDVALSLIVERQTR